jgi:hypothetical protein
MPGFLLGLGLEYRYLWKIISIIIKFISKMSYALVDYLDLFGGDLQPGENVDGWNNALNKAKELIGTDAGKCVVIHHQGPNYYRIYLKDPKKTNPSSEKSKHQICKALFYATTP